jgi:hypothetical protein
MNAAVPRVSEGAASGEGAEIPFVSVGKNAAGCRIFGAYTASAN